MKGFVALVGLVLNAADIEHEITEMRKGEGKQLAHL
jgi:hypothetical protein